MSGMDAIILAGGLGTRLRSVVPDLPKPLAPVGGRPFLDVLLAQLSRWPEIRRVILATGYKADLFRQRYGNDHRFGFEICFSTEESPLGTGGAILKALQFVTSDEILVLNGDSYVEFSLEELKRGYADARASLAMVVRRVDDASRYGSIELDGVTGQILGFREKAVGTGPAFVNAGVYLINKARLPVASDGFLSFEKDILPGMVGAMRAVIAQGKFIDIGVPETYAVAGSYIG
jgi:D-glycero-alpha-D-manno-heptose 1-phosphate guanylyltransferase